MNGILKCINALLPNGNFCPKTRQGLTALRTAAKRPCLQHEMHTLCAKCLQLNLDCVCMPKIPAQIVIFDIIAQIKSIFRGKYFMKKSILIKKIMKHLANIKSLQKILQL